MSVINQIIPLANTHREKIIFLFTIVLMAFSIAYASSQIRLEASEPALECIELPAIHHPNQEYY